MRTAQQDEYQEFVAARGPALRQAAYLLCGNWHEAEDLTQTALTKLYLAWRGVRMETAEAYARTVLFRVFLDTRRTARFRKEHLTAAPPERPTAGAEPEERLVMWEALGEVPPRQRAVLVLRFWHDLSVEETASMLQCSPGTVKSQSSRGLDSLRAVLADRYPAVSLPERIGI